MLEGEADNMTQTREAEVLAQAIELVDAGLGDLQTRNLVPASEVTDLLLDLRLLFLSVDTAEPSEPAGV